MKAALIALAALLMAVPAIAQSPAPAGVDTATVTTTPTGIRVVHCQESGTTLVAISVFIRRDAAEEGRLPGIGPFVARSIFGENLNQSRERVMRSVDEVGGSMDTAWTRDFLVINCVTGAANFEDAFWLISQAMTTASFDIETLARARADIADAARVLTTEPLSVAEAAVRSAVHGESPYRLPDTSAAFVSRLDRASALRYYARAFRAGGTVISVRGNVGLARTTELIERQLAEYPRGLPPEPPADKPVFDPPSASKSVAAATTTAVAVGMEAPPVRSSDYPAFSVLASIVGGGKSSRVVRSIRDTDGIGYSVGVSAPRTALPGDWMASVEYDSQAPGAPTPSDVVARIVRVLDGVVRDPPSQAEVDRAKRFTAGTHALAHQRLRDRCYLAGLFEALGGGARMDEDFGARVEAVTRADVIAAAERYLRRKVTVVAAPTVPGSPRPKPAK